MGSRGGRGRGRFGGGGFRSAKQEAFILFPDIELPTVDIDKCKELRGLVAVKNKLGQKLKNLPYFLEDTSSEKTQTVEIERYSDMGKNNSGTDRVSLENSGYMMLKPGYFPLELVQGTKRRAGRKVQWKPKRDLDKLDILEELEGKRKDGDGKKEGEEEEDEMEELEEEDDYEDDYAMVDDGGDDEDDYNMPEEADDEGIL